MKFASNVADRVEEYRYFSGSIGDVRPLPLRVLAVRMSAFHKVMRKANKAAKGGPQNNSTTRRRMR